MTDKPSAEDLLGEEWIAEYLRRMAYDGLTVEQMTIEINKWIKAVVNYGCHLFDEGILDDDEWSTAVRSSLDNANFNLDKFPKSKADR